MEILVSFLCLMVLCLSIGLVYVPDVYGVGIVMLCYSLPMFIYSCIKVYRRYSLLRSGYHEE
jgi:hypothetical protein